MNSFSDDPEIDAQIRRGFDRVKYVESLVQKSKEELAESEARSTKGAESEMALRLQRWSVEAMEANLENLKAGVTEYAFSNFEDPAVQ